ncbi:MAG: phosphopantetheine-binding protein [Acidobacteriota bacterium]
MSESQITDSNVFKILWSALEGGQYDLESLQRSVDRDTNLGEILDSLDMTDFVLRLEHHYKIKIAQADFPRLSSIATIEGYVRDKRPALTEA